VYLVFDSIHLSEIASSPMCLLNPQSVDVLEDSACLHMTGQHRGIVAEEHPADTLTGHERTRQGQHSH
jgi:hypothetical protein